MKSTPALLSRATLRTVAVFGLVPFFLYSTASVVAFALLFYFLLRGATLRNCVALLVAACLTLAFLSAPPPLTPTSAERASMILTSGSFALILLSPLMRARVVVREHWLVDASLLTFLVVASIATLTGVGPKGGLQIGMFTVAAYAGLVQGFRRRATYYLVILLSGARGIFAGVALGLLLQKSRKTLYLLSIGVLVLFAYGLLATDTLSALRDQLSLLENQGVLLKGRTKYWLSLLAEQTTLFGHGPGASVQAVSAMLGEYHVPHNDYLRVFVDYGFVPLALLFVSLWRNALRGPHELFVTAVLAAFLLTGNPLSFPTVIVSYLVTINCQPLNHEDIQSTRARELKYS
ncbi:MAG: hypothetical protein CMJ86_05765 [Planctomycetes bacterium]|nr:hypothetical protein [Planctomycetota bacterium]